MPRFSILCINFVVIKKCGGFLAGNYRIVSSSSPCNLDPRPRRRCFRSFRSLSLPFANPLGPPHLELLAAAQTPAMKYLARATLIFHGARTKRRGCANNSAAELSCVHACLRPPANACMHNALGTRKSRCVRCRDTGCRVSTHEFAEIISPKSSYTNTVKL